MSRIGQKLGSLIALVLSSSPTTYDPIYLFRYFANLGLSGLTCKMGILIPDEVVVRNK